MKQRSPPNQGNRSSVTLLIRHCCIPLWASFQARGEATLKIGHHKPDRLPMTNKVKPNHPTRNVFCRYFRRFVAAAVFFAIVAIELESLAQEYSEQLILPNEQLGASQEGFVEPSGLPRIRKLGKLVSIDGSGHEAEVFQEAKRMPDGNSTRSRILASSESNQDLGSTLLPELFRANQVPYTDYRFDESDITYMPGNGDQFGWVSLHSGLYNHKGYRSGLITGMNMHFLSGPDSVALPPRLYDFSLGYQKRGHIGDALSYDVASTIGVFSDFEDSARDGILFPGHAVGMLHYKPELDFVFGIDYLSRDDIKMLPVAGISWRPRSLESFRFDLVFPRPRIDYSFDSKSKMYVAGRLGGGTWDIEFPNDANDVMTYRDLQILFGIEQRNSGGSVSAWEFGYVFDRRLSFRTRTDDVAFDDAFILRLVTRK
jgi:hypothetical protein